MTPLTILLVDDSETDRATYRRFLSQSWPQAWEWVEFDQGEAALAWCQHQFPDLILLDYHLPDLDGLEFLATLQVQTGKSEFPLILLTGYGNIEIAVEAMKQGAQDYLDKSRCTATELQTRVQGVLERSHLKKSLAWQQERQRLVATTALRIRQSLALPDILQTAVEEVRALLESDRVLVYQFAADWSGTVVMESVASGYPTILGEVIHDPCIEHQWAEPYQQGSYTSHTNIPAEGLADCYAELMQRLQVQANLVIPILQTEQLWGLLIVHQCCSPRQWQDQEIELLQELAVQLAIAINQAEFQAQLQQELLQRQQTEIRLQAMFEQSPEAKVRFAPDGAAIAANHAWEVIWETSSESLVGYNILQEPSVFLEGNLADVMRVFAGETVFFPSFQAGRVGRSRWVETLMYPIKDGTGQVLEAVMVSRDVTEQITAQQELRESEARLQLAQEASNSGVWDWDISTNTIFWSPEYYQLYQLDRSIAPTYDNWLSSIHPEDQERVHQETLQALVASNPKLGVEFRIMLADGLHWFAAIGQVFRDASAQPVRMTGIVIDITQRKQAEIALQTLNAELEQRVVQRTADLSSTNQLLQSALIEQQQAKQEIEDLYNTAPCGYHSLDRDGTVIRINDTELSWLGYQRDEVVNKIKFTDCLTPESQARFRQNFPQFLEQGWIHNLEFQLCHQDGSTRWINVSASAIKDSAGNFVMSRSSAFDISARKHADLLVQQQNQMEQLRWAITQAIRQSLELPTILNATVEQIQATLQCDRTAVYRFLPDWSGNFVAESVGDGWIRLVGSDIQKVHQDTYLQRTAGGRFRNHEVFIVPNIYTIGLEPCHIELLEQFQAKAYAVVPVFAREQLWGLLAVYQNAQPRQWQTWEIELLQQVASQLSLALQQANLYNQLQIELRERMQAVAEIEEAERRWRSLVENVQLIVIELNQSGQVTYVNPFFLQLTGYTNSEVLGQNWFETFIPPSRQTTIQIKFAQVLAHQAAPYHQNPILTKSGEERLIAWTNTVRHDLDGQSIGSISIGEDITERHKVEKMKSEFLSIVSHELRTPLTSISGALELLSTGLLPFDSERGQQSLQIAASESDRLTRLVNDILDLERLEAGKVKLSLHPYNLASLMQRALASMQVLATQHQITLSVTPLSITVNVDSDRLLQVLTNLLSNAIKFSEPQTTIWLTAEVVTAAATNCDFVCVTVRDQGRGIPSHKLETIFDRFQQVDASDSRKKGGTGLGLAICQNIIQQHGGRIWAESVLGQGSQFHFTLLI